MAIRKSSMEKNCLVVLKFLIPSVTKTAHYKFLESCITSVLQQFPGCEIKLVYEAQAALLACKSAAVGDFGGFTFDQASPNRHEACNLAASNIDMIVDQLVRAQTTDLRISNRD